MRRFCIVGSGPAGFYTASNILKAFGDSSAVRVDIIESLPVPYGLVRFGVAPDHPEVKNVTSKFESVLADERCKFFGNVTVGKDIAVEDLKRNYAATVFSNGTPSDHRLKIPGGNAAGVLTGREFTNWYNGHPDFATQLKVDLSRTQRVAIIGNGNVAVDVARILLKSPAELERTDISTVALAALRNSAVKDVYMVGRRGAAQAAWSIAELRELSNLESVGITVEGVDDISEADREEITSSRPLARSFKLLQDIAAAPKQNCAKNLHLRFLASPQKINSILDQNSNQNSVVGVTFAKNRLEGPKGKQIAVASGGEINIPADLVVACVGYKGERIPGVPWDSTTNTFPNSLGRILDENGKVVAGLYCSGWARRGPKGVILTNIVDAKETTNSILADVSSGLRPITDSSQFDLADFLTERKVPFITTALMEKILAEEKRIGTKILTREEMLRLAFNE